MHLMISRLFLLCFFCVVAALKETDNNSTKRDERAPNTGEEPTEYGLAPYKSDYTGSRVFSVSPRPHILPSDIPERGCTDSYTSFQSEYSWIFFIGILFIALAFVFCLFIYILFKK